VCSTVAWESAQPSVGLTSKLRGALQRGLGASVGNGLGGVRQPGRTAAFKRELSACGCSGCRGGQGRHGERASASDAGAARAGALAGIPASGVLHLLRVSVQPVAKGGYAV